MVQTNTLSAAVKTPAAEVFLPDADFCRAVAAEVVTITGLPFSKILKAYSQKDKDADACYRARHMLVAVAYAQKQGNLVEPALDGLMENGGLSFAEMHSQAARMRKDTTFNQQTTKLLMRMRAHPAYGHVMSMMW